MAHDFPSADLGPEIPMNQAEVPQQIEYINGQEVLVIGDPTGYAEFNHKQGDNPYGYTEDCGLVSCQDVLNQFGVQVSETDVVNFTSQHGLCDTSEADPSQNGGTTMEQQASLGPLSPAISTFLKMTRSYWPGLFQCYDMADLPRTDNELEQCFGSVRYSERRASGRRGAIAGLVVRGPVRVVTALALHRQCFLPRVLYLQDPDAWYTMRDQLTSRREGRRKQLRFRKDPAAYLAALEEILLKTSLPPLVFAPQPLGGPLQPVQTERNPYGRSSYA